MANVAVAIEPISDSLPLTGIYCVTNSIVVKLQPIFQAGAGRPSGNYSISNFVYAATGPGEQSPSAGISVLAIDAASGELIAVAVSALDGSYQFSNLSSAPVIVVAVDLTIGRVAAVQNPVIPD